MRPHPYQSKPVVFAGDRCTLRVWSLAELVKKKKTVSKSSRTHSVAFFIVAVAGIAVTATAAPFAYQAG